LRAQDSRAQGRRFGRRRGWSLKTYLHVSTSDTTPHHWHFLSDPSNQSEPHATMHVPRRRPSCPPSPLEHVCTTQPDCLSKAHAGKHRPSHQPKESEYAREGRRRLADGSMTRHDHMHNASWLAFFLLIFDMDVLPIATKYVHVLIP